MLASPIFASTTTSGMPFTNSTMSGMMQLFTQPGVSMRNWLMAWKTFRSGWAKSISCTTGSASPVSSLTIHLRLEEKRLHRLVGFQQRAVGLAEDLVAQIVELAVGQPGLAVGGEVERPDRVAEHLRQKPLAEARRAGWPPDRTG